MSRFIDCFLSPVLLALLATSPAILHAAPHASDKATDSRPQYTENRDAPTILQAEQITGRPARDLYLDYEVEIERDQTLITGDHGIFRQEENETEIIGNVFIQRFGDQFVADDSYLCCLSEGLTVHARALIPTGICPRKKYIWTIRTIPHTPPVRCCISRMFPFWPHLP